MCILISYTSSLGFIRIYGTVEADKNTHKLSPFHLSFPSVMVSSISQCNDRTINTQWTGHGEWGTRPGTGQAQPQGATTFVNGHTRTQTFCHVTYMDNTIVGFSEILNNN